MRLLARVPWILLALLLIGVAWSIRPVSDTDILWHLRAGQWMLAHGDVIRQDSFSVTRWGCAWVCVPWLHEVLLARLLAACGWLGPTLWQTGFVAAIALQTALLVWLLRRPGVSGRWGWRWPHLSIPAALAVLATLRLLQMRINHRPEMNTYLLVGADLIVLTLFAQTSSAAACRWLPWLPPLLQLWWVNTHGAFFLGPLLVAAFAGAAWIAVIAGHWHAARGGALHPDAAHAARLGDGARPRAPAGWLATLPALRLTLSTLLTALACLATPYGMAGTLYPLHLFSVLTDPLYKNAIMEGRPVDLAMALDSGSLGYALLAAWVFAGLGLLGRLLEGAWKEAGSRAAVVGLWHATAHELGLGYLAVVAALAYLSLTAIRNVPLMPLVAAPLIASGLEYAADGVAAVAGRIVARLRHARGPAGAVAAVAWLHGPVARVVGRLLLAAALLLLYRAIVSERFYDALGWRTRFAIGFSDHEHPLAACDFLARHQAELGFVAGGAARGNSRPPPDAGAGTPRVMAVYGDTRSANTLLWRFGPAWKTYFDGRHAEIYDPAIFRTAIATRGDRALFLREAATYEIGLACFSLADRNEQPSPLASFLYQPSNRWSLVYLDDCAAVFVARAAADAAFTSRFALPPPPTDATAQRAVFDAWLAKQGRTGLSALDDPANEALEHGTLAAGLVRTLQLGGLWSPARHPDALRYCRLAAFLDNLGWRVVADDLYAPALREPDAWPAVLPRALKHALAVHRDAPDPAVRSDMLARIRSRTALLRRVEPAGFLAAYGQAYVDAAEGRHAAAAATLQALLAHGGDIALFDLLIPSQMHLADAAEDPSTRTRLWREGVRACRERLLLCPDDARAWQVHAWISDLAGRLGEPLVADANERLVVSDTNRVSSESGR